jgi:hypothetical protein
VRSRERKREQEQEQEQEQERGQSEELLFYKESGDSGAKAGLP